MGIGKVAIPESGPRLAILSETNAAWNGSLQALRRIRLCRQVQFRLSHSS